VGPRAGLDAVVKRKISSPRRLSNPRSSRVVQGANEIPFTFECVEYAQMHYVYGFGDGNGRASVAKYQQRFPNGRIPHGNVFYNVHTCV
jgi:hypothetical protein